MQSDLDLELADGLLADYLYSWSGEYEIRKIVIDWIYGGNKETSM